MARIAGVDIPNNKRVEIALTYIYGIGLKSSKDILKITGIDPDKRAKDLTEEETAAVVEKFKALVEANGTLDELEEMGKRKLAYEINYITEGYYVLMKFTSAPEFPAELDRILGITDGILRRLITLRAE